MPKARCPNCDAWVNVDGPEMGSTVRCRECDMDLEIISLSPFEIDFPLDYEEDWGDDV